MVNKISKNKINIIILISILVLAFLLRVQYLDKPLQRDEPLFFEAAENLNEKKNPIFCEMCVDEHGKTLKIFNYHPPLFLSYLSIIIQVFSLNETVLRFLIVVFSISTIFLTYLIGYETGGKKLGFVAAFLLAINRLHIEHSQIIDIDGSFFTFFIILNILLFIKWFKSNNKKYLILSIIALTGSLLTKESAVLIFIPLFFYLFKKRKTDKFLEIASVTISLSLIFIFLFNFYFSVNIFEGVLNQLNRITAEKTIESRLTRLYQFSGIVTWEFTPPFILISLYSIFYNWKKKNQYFIFLIYVTVLFVFFYTLIFGITRYFVPIIPILCLLISSYILERRGGIKNIAFILIIAFLCFSGFYYLKIRTDINFLNNIKTNFTLITIPYVLCLVPITLYFTKYRSLALITLIGMTIGYNLYFGQEAINPLVTPDYNKAVIDAAEFIKNSSIESPVITTHDIALYSNREYYDVEGPLMNVKSIDTLTKENKANYIIYKTNTVVIQPSVDEFLESSCKKVKSGISNNVEVFKVFQC